MHIESEAVRSARSRAPLYAGPRSEEYPRDLAELYAAMPHKPDWERLIEAGMVPALILGAERRTRRGPAP
jgi:hypothetical protein